MIAKKYPLRELAVGATLTVKQPPKNFQDYARRYGAGIGYVFSALMNPDGSVTVVRRA